MVIRVGYKKAGGAAFGINRHYLRHVANTQFAFDFFDNVKIAGDRLDILCNTANVYVTLQYRGDFCRLGFCGFVRFDLFPPFLCIFIYMYTPDTYSLVFASILVMA